jgi:multidrug resistance efflux pump
VREEYKTQLRQYESKLDENAKDYESYEAKVSKILQANIAHANEEFAVVRSVYFRLRVVCVMVQLDVWSSITITQTMHYTLTH